MTVQICLVNAGAPLSDAEVAALVPALQVYDDTMVRPAWDFAPCTYSFMSWAQFEAAPPAPDVWPIFLNKHSTDASVLGWHDDKNGLVFGRVFVGDAIRDGISWTVDLSHECTEMRGNPVLTAYVTLPDGRLALRELCDPVEADELAIEVTVGGISYKLSDFVLPAYFTGGDPDYDWQRKLAAPCPALAPGGYQSIYAGGEWTQETADLLTGGKSVRAARFARSHRMPRVAPA